MVVAGARNHVELLLAGEVDELHRVAGDADREVGVLGLLGMLHRIFELLDAKHIDVQVVRAVGKVAVKHVDQVAHALRLVGAKRAGVDGLRIGDAVQCVLVGQLGHGVEAGEKSVLLGAVAGVCAGREGRVGRTAVRQGAGGLAVHHVGRDGEDGRRG